MINLFPFKYNEEADAFKKKCLTEPDIRAPEILAILIAATKKDPGLQTRKERSQGYNDRPFDLIVGDPHEFQMDGYEIKSDLDTYERLHDQLDSYLFLFDNTYLVLHKKEPPEWLPRECGVVRISTDGTGIIETYSRSRGYWEITTGYDWEQLLARNDIGGSQAKLKEITEISESIRRNLLFNRFFASNRDGEAEDQFYPMTRAQKDFILGFSLKENMASIKRDVKKIENRLEMIRGLAGMNRDQKLPGAE